MSDVVEEARRFYNLRGDTYSSAEMFGLIGRMAAEIERLRELKTPASRQLLNITKDQAVSPETNATATPWRETGVQSRAI
jgi:hypothetical protein